MHAEFYSYATMTHSMSAGSTLAAFGRGVPAERWVRFRGLVDRAPDAAFFYGSFITCDGGLNAERRGKDPPSTRVPG